MSETLTHRDGILRFVPPWLTKKWLGRLLWGIQLQVDAFAEQTRYAVWIHFPGYYTTEDRVLALEGAQRGIPRGWGEPAEAYAERLIGWRDAHRKAGSPMVLLQQLHALFTQYKASGIGIKVISNSGYVYAIDTEGTITRYQTTWNWDGQSTAWNRYWVVLYIPGLYQTEGIWSDTISGLAGEGIWGDLPHTIGSTLTEEQVATMRSVIAQWNSAHATCMNIILAFTANNYTALGAVGASNNALSPVLGNWDRWHNRPNFLAFLDGTT